MTTVASPLPSQLELVHERAAALVARAQWSPERLRAHRRERLRALVAHAVARSPYYRERLGADVARGDIVLEELPTLPKQTMMREFDRIVTEPNLRRAELEAHLAGPHAGSPFHGRYRVFATSGSSGLRGIVVHSEDEFTTWIAAHLPFFARVGLGPSTRLAAIGAPSPIHLSKQLFAAFQQDRSGAPRLSALTPMHETIDVLRSFQPEAIIGYASVIAAIAREQVEGRVHVGPRIVITGAEVLTSEMEQRIVEAWGIHPHQVYATTEIPIIAAGAPEHRELCALDDLAWVEVVDEQNQPVPPGTPGYKVLITNLVNRAQPLIRYELTDSVTLAESGRIASIDGRSDDILRLQGKDGGEVAVPPFLLGAPFARLSEVDSYQLTYDGRTLGVRVVLRPNAAPDAVAHIRRSLLEALDRAGAAPPLDVQAVASIEREGYAAKLKLVKRLAAGEHVDTQQ
jgi:phenylacetate-CoA ligase